MRTQRTWSVGYLRGCQSRNRRIRDGSPYNERYFPRIYRLSSCSLDTSYPARHGLDPDRSQPCSSQTAAQKVTRFHYAEDTATFKVVIVSVYLTQRVFSYYQTSLLTSPSAAANTLEIQARHARSSQASRGTS